MQKYLHTTLRLWKLLKPFHKLFYLQLFLVGIVSILDLYYSVYLGKIITALTTKNIQEIAYAVVFFFLFAIAYWTLDMARDYLYAIKIVRQIYQHLREFSLNKVLSFNVSQLEDNNSMYSFSVISRGEEKSETYITRLVSQIIPTIFSLLISLYFLYKQSYLFAIILCIFSVLVIIMEHFYNKNTKDQRRLLVDLNHQQGKITAGVFSHLSTIKLLAVSQKFMKSFLKKRKENMDENISFDKKKEYFEGIRNYLIEIGNMSFVVVGVWLYLNGKIGYITPN